jgi:hypothetical protein
MTLNDFVKIKQFTVSDAIIDYCDILKTSNDEVDHGRAVVLEKLYKEQILQHKDKYEVTCQINNNLDIAIQIKQKKDYKVDKKKDSKKKKDLIAELMASKLQDKLDRLGKVFYLQKGSVGYSRDQKTKDQLDPILKEMGISMDLFLEPEKEAQHKQECFFSDGMDLIEKDNAAFDHFDAIRKKFSKGLNGYSLSND